MTVRSRFQPATRSPAKRIAWQILTMILLSANTTHAQTDTLDAGGAVNLIAGAVLAHEDNVFHLSPGTDPETVLGKSSGADTASIGFLGLIVDKRYSQQHFLLDARASHYRYKNFRFLDFSATKYQGSWEWSATHWLTGSIEANREQVLINFADFQDYTKRNTRSTKNESFNIDGDLSGGWHLIGKTTQLSRKDTYTIAGEGSLKQNADETGIKYLAPSGSWLALVLRTISGKYTDQRIDPHLVFDKGYKQHDLELRASWLITGKSMLSATLTHLNRHHQNFAQRDYSGVGHEITYKWTPTGKLNFEFGSKREIASYQEATSSYATIDGINATATWTIYPRTTLHLKAEESHRNFFGPVIPVTDLRTDRNHSLQTGLEWSPMKNLMLTANLQREQRTSNRSMFEYSAQSYSLAAQLIF